MSMLLDSSGLFDAIAAALADGMPVFGTCAGMILLASEVLDGRADQRRSAPSTSPCAATPTGARSTASRPTSTSSASTAPFHAVFIRAPDRRAGRRRRRRARQPRRPAGACSGSDHVTVGVLPPRAVGRRPPARPFPAGGPSLMSGHSKWATIKHQKGAKDKARGKLFAKLIRQVEVAAREGGGDIDGNPTLRTMVRKAQGGVGADRHHRPRHQARHRRARGRHLRVDHVRGLRPWRRGGAGRRAHRQPQPHRRRDPQPVLDMGGSMAEPGAVSWQFSAGRSCSCRSASARTT